MYVLIQYLLSFSFKDANSYFIVKCNMHNGIYCLSIISFSRLIWQMSGRHFGNLRATSRGI